MGQALEFLWDEFSFSNQSDAKEVRDKYFSQYHSAMRGLAAAAREGALPDPRGGLAPGQWDSWGRPERDKVKPLTLPIIALPSPPHPPPTPPTLLRRVCPPFNHF